MNTFWFKEFRFFATFGGKTSELTLNEIECVNDEEIFSVNIEMREKTNDTK